MNTYITWDTESWKKRFQHAAKAKNHHELHALRIEVYRNTLEIVRRGQYETSQGLRISLDNAESLIAGSRFYTQELSPAISTSSITFIK